MISFVKEPDDGIIEEVRGSLKVLQFILMCQFSGQIHLVSLENHKCQPVGTSKGLHVHTHGREIPHKHLFAVIISVTTENLSQPTVLNPNINLQPGPH